MKILLLLLSIITLFGCAKTRALNDKIFEVQKQELLDSPFKSAKDAMVKIEAQKRFRLKGHPYFFKETIFKDSSSDTIIVIEEFDEVCNNCSSSKSMVLLNGTIYSLERELGKNYKASYKTSQEPYKTVSLDNEYLSKYHQFLVINRKFKSYAIRETTPLNFGSDSCLGGDYTLATVIYPNKEIKSMFVRCWWLESSWEYLKK